jgi:hypothetical protein
MDAAGCQRQPRGVWSWTDTVAVAHFGEQERQEQVLQLPSGHVVRLLVPRKQAQLAHSLRRTAQGGHPVRQVGLVMRREVK